MTNGCEIQAGGTDVMKYGGCDLSDTADTFVCGSKQCNAQTEYCNISINDVSGADEPEFYNNCVALPDDCPQGDCSCMPPVEFSSCYDATGFTMVF
jgi:hypothetical protein